MSAAGRAAAPAILLSLAVLAAYANALTGPFQFDDWWAVVDNPAVHDLNAWWQSLPGIRPLLKLSWALNWQLGSGAAGFHAVNIAAHGLNSLLLLAIARRLLPQLAPTVVAPERAAFAWALLFALHPAATEVVTYISGRSLGLSATGYLAAIYFHLRANGSEPRWRHASALAFALALGVRETTLTLPLTLLLLDRCRGNDWRSALRAQRLLWVVALLAVIAAASTPGYRSFFGWSLQTRGIGEQLMGQLAAHRYLLTGPLLGRLNIDPDVQVPVGPDVGTLFGLLGMGCLAVLGWQQRRQRPWIGFALAWYLLHLLPSNSLLPRFDLANDRHLYLALPGALLPLAVLLDRLRAPRRAHATLLLAALLLAAGTIRRNHDYRSELSLWQATVASSPRKPRAWVNLGWAQQQAGATPLAVTAYRCALAFDPRHLQARLNLVALGIDPKPAPEAGCVPGDSQQGRP